MGWASRRKEGRVALLGEDGKPVEMEKVNGQDGPTAPEGEAPASPEVGQPDPAILPRIEIAVRPDGNLSITGPGDPRLVLRMLHEALDLVQMGVVRKGILEQIAAAPVAKPGLRDVLAFSKVRPR